MPRDYLKLPLADGLNRLAAQRAADAIQFLGKNLPCHVVAVAGQMVTVAFDVIPPHGVTLEQVTMPLGTSAYDWIPVQIGDRGVTRAADTSLGGLSGLGAGTPNLAVTPGNLGALIFEPVAHATWTTDDPDKRVVQGPNGVTLRDLVGTASVTVGLGEAVLSASGHSIVINASGVIIDGVAFLPHQHDGVQAGSGVSGPVV